MLVLASLFVFTVAGTVRAQDPTTTGAATTNPNATTPPPTTEAPDPLATSTEIDVRLSTWSDELTPVYVSLFARMASVPARRVEMKQYGRYTAIEYGSEYLLSLQIQEGINSSTLDVGGTNEEVAALLEAALNAGVADGHVELRQRGVMGARRVLPESRQSEQGSLSINFTWVAFLLLGLVMIAITVVVLLRRRPASEEVTQDPDEAEAELADVEKRIPADLVPENEKRLLELVDRAEQQRQAELRAERIAATYAPSRQLFQQTLETDHRLRLPPPCKVPDPLAPSMAPRSPSNAEGPGSRGGVQMGAAARAALQSLHEEMERDDRQRHGVAEPTSTTLNDGLGDSATFALSQSTTTTSAVPPGGGSLSRSMSRVIL